MRFNARIVRAAKALLRQAARARLDEIPAAERAAFSAEICRRLQATPAWKAARAVGLYAAMALEPDLSALWQAPGKILCFPRVDGLDLRFYRVRLAGRVWCRRANGACWSQTPRVARRSSRMRSICFSCRASPLTWPAGAWAGAAAITTGFWDGPRPPRRRWASVSTRRSCRRFPLEEHDICVQAVVTEQGVFRDGSVQEM